MNVKVKLLEGGIMPKRGKAGDAGFDVYLPADVLIHANSTVTIDTAVCIELPEGYAAQFVVRSSVSRSGLIVQPPLIDANYRGELHIIASNFTNVDLTFSKGDRLCSLFIVPVFTGDLEEVDELSETNRGSDWSGSTGA